MKKTFYHILIFFFITISQSSSEIVYIDINKILNESNAGKKALGELEENINKRNEFFSSTEKKLINEEKKIMKQKNILSEEDFNKKLIDLSNKVKNSTIIPIYHKNKYYQNKLIRFLHTFYIAFKLRTDFKNMDIVKTNQLMGSWIGIILKFFNKTPLIVRTGYDIFSFSLKKPA